MRVALVLHIYQPPVQEDFVVKQVASECYLPLIKLIKNSRNHHFTLNIPLSLLELMEKNGYKEWISDVRSLYEAGRIELTGSAAYHPLLPSLPEKLVEEEIVLNEYGLGYYFGSKQGFEGEPSMLIKDIRGFFPPELALNHNLVKTLSGLEYDWVLAEETAIPGGIKDNDVTSCVYALPDCLTRVVCRSRSISNSLSFKRDLNLEDIMGFIKDSASKTSKEAPMIVALDGEYFGHHFREGIYLLDSLLSRLEGLGIYLDTVSEAIKDTPAREIAMINESSWGASDSDVNDGQVYPFWVSSDNKVQVKLWDLQNFVIENAYGEHSVKQDDDLLAAPIWKDEVVSKISDKTIYDSVIKYILIHKYLHSDKFWWSSKKQILGKYLYHPGMVKASLDICKKIISCCEKPELTDEVNLRIQDIKSLLE